MASASVAVSVVIVNYCTRDLVRNCVLSLRDHAGEGVEVIVVDNHSNDDSVAMLRREFPEAQLIANGNNRGFAQANNQGIAQSGGKYVLLLNSDTLVRPSAIPTMLDFMNAHPGAGAVGCRLLYADGRIQPSVSRRSGPAVLGLLLRLAGLSRLIRSDRTRRFLRRYLGFLLGSSVRAYLDPFAADDSPFAVETISGACLMLRRTAIDQVGGLDERFFMYLEDLDCCLRLRKAGWNLYYVPTAEVIHLVGSSSGGRMRNYSVQAYESLLYFYRKHYSTRLWRVRAALVAAFAVRWLLSGIVQLFFTDASGRQNRADMLKIISAAYHWPIPDRAVAAEELGQQDPRAS